MTNWFERAQKVLPGGVNSPVRSFQAVGREPLFIERAVGSKLYDVEGCEYIDYVCSWGPMILGHNNPAILQSVTEVAQNGLSFGAPTVGEVLLAELMVELIPGLEMLRMVNSGTEGVMSALRVARGYTNRSKIIKFDGCYHGHSDGMLVKAGSGALTLSQPDSSGVTAGMAADTLIAVYNDLDSVAELFAQNKDNVAAVIVEPVAANMGVVVPKKVFLEGLRKLCDEHGALLIFDEVITGFRLALGGAQEYFGVRADLVVFGKIIGGGMPVGAYGGRREIMNMVSPLGSVYQAGTLSGNPVAMAAGLAQLKELQSRQGLYADLEKKAIILANGFRQIAEELHLPIQVNQVSSLVCAFFTDCVVDDFAAAKNSDTNLYAKFFRIMLSKGVNLAPAQFEAMFISAAHSDEDLRKTLEVAREALIEMKSDGDFLG